MKRLLDWFNGQSKKRRVLIVSPILLLVALGVIDSWHTRDTSVESKGAVLAEGRLGAFRATGENGFTSKLTTQRFVIGKVEVFSPGTLSGFPPDCLTTGTASRVPDCSSTPDEWPIVVIWLRCYGDLFDCAGPLDAACRIEELKHLPGAKTYIWWERASAGQRKRHRCAYNDQAETGDEWVMGFVVEGTAAPKRFSLVVQGRDVPIRLTQ